MSAIVRATDRVVVHGLTGRQGSFWTERMRTYGTNVVAGVSPTKAGSTHDGLPVFASASDAGAAVGIDVAVTFVPPAAAPAAVADAIDAGARVVVALTEFIPVHETMRMVAHARAAGAHLIGPNTAGVVTVGEALVGFMPAFDPRIFAAGGVGVVSRSGSLGTLAALELTRAGLGQSCFIGIGGDPVSGTSTAEAIAALADHDRTEAIVVIGEIGGTKEQDAAGEIAATGKPVVAFVAGRSAPAGRRMGHAGALVEGHSGTYHAKRNALEAAGATVVDLPSQIPAALRSFLE